MDSTSRSTTLTTQGNASLLLDTNVWSEIAYRDTAAAFDELISRRRWRVLLAPATLLEVGRDGNDDRRRSIFRAITRRRRVRLPTEAQREAAEVVAAIRQLRPRWLNRSPVGLPRLRQLETFWTNELWVMARHQPDEIAKAHRRTSDPAVRDAIVAGQRRTSAAAKEARAPLDPTDLYVDLRRSRVPRWLVEHVGREERIEAWRVQNAILWSQHLVEPTFGLVPGRDTTLADWFVPYIQLEVVKQDAQSWLDFWYRDVQAKDVPRNWMRWAVDLIQSKPDIKITDGNPEDAQLAAYLYDADVFLTADKRFGRVLKALRPAAPIAFATTAYIDFRPADLVAMIEASVLRPVDPDS